MTWLVVSVHDVAPATAAACRAWARDLDRLGVPSSLLVIPGPWRGTSVLHDAETAAWLHRRVEAGDEVVQHGWLHDGVPGGARWRRAVGKVVARGCAEFVALDEEEAVRRLHHGREVLDHLGFAVDGFTPPGWLASPGSLRAVRRLGFRYTTSHVGIHSLPAGPVVRAPALSHRPGGRGERAALEVLTRTPRRAAAAGRGVRIALHPADRDRPGLVEATLDAIAEVVALGATPLTYRAVASAVADRAARVMARILQLANFVAPLSGGIRTTLDALGAGYEAAGHERLLLVPGPDDAVDGHRIVLRGRRLPGQPYRVLTDVERVRRTVRALRPDRVEVSDKLTLTSIGGLGPRSLLLSHERLDAILRPRVPRAVPLRQAGDAVNRRVAASFDRIVCTSSFSAEEWRRIGVVPTVVPLGVDLDLFRPQARIERAAAGRHDVELVTVGRLSAEKRPGRAMASVAGLRAEGIDATLTFVGDGPLRRRLERTARRSGLPVRFAGHLADRAAVASALASADVAVCPCPHETFGLAAVEALACGTPVAVPEGGALADLVLGGPAGCGAADDDLAAAVMTCLQSGSRSAARRRARDFPWSRSVAGLLDAHDLRPPVPSPASSEAATA